MNKAKLLLVLAFIVVCAAGAVVGTAVDRHARPAPVVAPFDWLTPEQAKAMKPIWSPVGELRRKVWGERRQLERDRRDEFEKLLTPEQLASYKKTQQEYEAKFKALDDQVHQAEHDADLKTRALLSPEQLKRYDEVRAKMGPPRFGPPHMRRGDHDHPRSTSGPSSAPDPSSSN